MVPPVLSCGIAALVVATIAVVVMMLVGFLLVLFRVILRADGQRSHGRQRACREGEENRLPSVMTHRVTLMVMGACAILEYPRRTDKAGSRRFSVGFGLRPMGSDWP
jgi:hypothetical protein